MNHQVLVVDDEVGMRAALELSFRQRGWEVDSAQGKLEALARFEAKRHGLIVTDVRMPDGCGFDVLKTARALQPGTAVILLTAYGSVPDAVQAMKSGACEYLVKPVSFEQLLDSAERVMRAGKSERTPTPREIVGSSPALLATLELARQAAASDADILIQAESGTGKELLARMIHDHGLRRERPFIAVNCAGFPGGLLESELFGHGRGAFTGATSAQPGKFQLADGGTLLLDEIAEMPLDLQPKLLRALQEREFYRLGESRPVKVNIRVIATTNRALLELVRDGSFRADLYYRLNVIPLSLPPLRERGDDVRELALHFAKVFQQDGDRALPDSFLSLLEKHNWPGNVRELANVVRRAITLGRFQSFSEDNISEPKAQFAGGTPFADIPALGRVDGLSSLLTAANRSSMKLEPGMSLEAMERHLLEMTLDATGGNRSRAAEMLGISLRTVRNKIREYQLPSRRDYAHAND